MTAGVAPGPGVVVAMASRFVETVDRREAAPERSSGQKPGTIEDKLSTLSDLCAKSLLTPAECADARARIIDSIAMPANAGDNKPANAGGQPDGASGHSR